MAKLSISQTKQRVSHLFHTVEKATLAKAKSLIKIPRILERRRLTNERILERLKQTGVATQEDVKTLEARIESIENALKSSPRSPTKIKKPALVSSPKSFSSQKTTAKNTGHTAANSTKSGRSPRV